MRALRLRWARWRLRRFVRRGQLILAQRQILRDIERRVS